MPDMTPEMRDAIQTLLQENASDDFILAATGCTEAQLDYMIDHWTM